MPRPYTEEEMRQSYLDHVRTLIEYWEREGRAKSSREKLEGLAFSILVMIDGGSALPGCQLIPSPHPDDKAYREENGENYFPEGVDIGGALHESLSCPNASTKEGE